MRTDASTCVVCGRRPRHTAHLCMDCRTAMEHTYVVVGSTRELRARETTAMDILLTVLREYKAEWRQSLETAGHQAMLNQAYPMMVAGADGRISQVREAEHAVAIANLQAELDQEKAENQRLRERLGSPTPVSDLLERQFKEEQAQSTPGPESLDLEKEFGDG